MKVNYVYNFLGIIFYINGLPLTIFFNNLNLFYYLLIIMALLIVLLLLIFIFERVIYRDGLSLIILYFIYHLHL